MASASVEEFTSAWWSEVCNRIIGAVVFIDDPTAECLHWEGGMFNIMSQGAQSLRSLSPFELDGSSITDSHGHLSLPLEEVAMEVEIESTMSCSKEFKKAVFITQCTPIHLSVVNEIIKHSDLTHCILISCTSLDVVYVELNEDRDVSDVIAAGRGQAECTKQLESMITSWMAKTQCLVDVVHIPIFTIPLTSNIFATPPFASIYPTFDCRLTTEAVSDLYALSPEERTRVRRLASGLNSMLDSLNLKEEVHYMGPYSSLVAGVLENSPVSLNRRKNCLHPAALIIIDRTLDLCGITSHSSESMLDKILAVLPKFPGHTNDVAVDMGVLCQAEVLNHPEDIQVSPGCLFHAGDESCIQTFENMINKSQKEVMLDLYNKLSKIDITRSPSPKNLLKVTPQSLEKIVNFTKGNYDLISDNLGLLQQALAVVQTLKSPQKAQLDLLMNLEKQVLQSLAVSRDSTSVLQQVSHLIKTRKERNLPLSNLLALVVHIYSLTGTEVTFPSLHEENLIETLSVALFEDNEQLLVADPGAMVTPEECTKLSVMIMDRLKQISCMRKGLKRYNSVLKPCENGVGDEYRGLLQQLVDDIVDTNRPELVDLHHRSDGIKELFRTGFNILTIKKSRGPRHPLDNQTVIIFVIGGMTGEECKRLHRSVITSGIDNTVIFGTTKLVTPNEAMRDVLAI